MKASMKWIGASALAAGIILTGGRWASAQQDWDDCEPSHRVGFWRWSFPIESYSYRTYEPRWYTTREEVFITSEPSGYVTRNNELSRAQAFHGYRTRPMMTTTVRLASGGDIGRVEELVISDTGSVDYMIVSFTNLPRLGTKLAAIPFGAAQVNFRTRVATLDMERDELYDAPIFFTRGSWPNLYEGEWASKVHAHFGVDATRIERAYSRPEEESMREDMKKTRPREGLQQPTAQPRAPRPQPDSLPRESRSAPPAREIQRDATPDRDAIPRPAPDRPAPGQKDDSSKQGEDSDKPQNNNKSKKGQDNENDKPAPQNNNKSNLPD